jgi:DNA-directed RNA polymerase specialized sigma24 family protein
MSSAGSVTAWIDELCAGNRAAAEPLWRGYFQRLVGLARQKLRGRLRSAMAGAEDVALSAFDSFYRAAEQGRFPQLSDRDDLWRLLFVITERKAIDLVKHENAIRRGGGKVQSLNALCEQNSTSDRAPAEIASREPTPEEVAEITDNCRRLLALLGDDALRDVALAKMEGYTNKEIGERLKLAEPTIERKLGQQPNSPVSSSVCLSGAAGVQPSPPLPNHAPSGDPRCPVNSRTASESSKGVLGCHALRRLRACHPTRTF